MKSLLLMSLLVVVMSMMAFSQETLQVDVTKLDQRQLSLYQDLKKMQSGANSLENITPDKMDKYAQIGKAFGSAFKECWSAVSTDAEKFAQSSTGKWAMVLVSWKIMGQDAVSLTKTVVRWIVGGVLLSVGSLFFMYMTYRNCIKAPIASIEQTGFFTKKIVYSEENPIHSGDVGGYAVAFVIFTVITVLIMFV